MTYLPCPVCRVHKYDPDRFEKCYHCTMETSGMRKCPECQENYFDPERFETCYECWKDREKEENDDDDEDKPEDPDPLTVFPTL